MMTNTYQIEQVSYDIICQASNLNTQEKSKLYGFTSSYVAVRLNSSGQYDVLMETLGNRDQCLKMLRSLNNQPSVENNHVYKPSSNHRKRM